MLFLGSYAGRIDTTDKPQRVSVEFFGLRERDRTKRLGENGAPDVKLWSYLRRLSQELFPTY